ncbi:MULTISPECIES: aminotransferase class I/II-fold pyridoxal phosphate-dependent enzyme [Tatumella]|uniref:Aminotransferase class I/II-fold pyridoxal phosphate-dependent enzyme n=1 Tax=Tatumella punctata TaxID=399969 RepID=A0ABW1VSV4_9GAMM|nr:MULTISPECIES: aminotransferase class I/II-fold pyridoxal phosphate-dependent enzyme [unclassified Tatumella]MBS0856044.1 aminotransferase class I/II-fold pyridoxal phosphate-dependent enzyme [Tatumella sp. JGM16]MBS0878103.1 aminotransferase class I/II-fold pyridoxal phosphate-dependent enzyme [Tatumella sp. JGM82]MBS0890462.1 aminotransferase class I/II-fold pyridoxal phosphate-dependent enzyme [Tatumella sp. JGM94]MBS0895154.1 aminotransferase class I/II-fold pyridoxal phosphate-dependent 
MGLYDKFSRLKNQRQYFSHSGLNPFGTCIDEVYSATEGRIGDRRVILAGTNNYLGLTFDPQAIADGQMAMAQQGTGTTGSRMANGSYGSHLALEQELAAFFGRPSAIVFSTGYTANLAVISTLACPGAVVLIDADSHASIYDACALGGAEIIRFRHNDVADLDRRLQRLGERAAEALIIVEGIYSMLGDVAPLAEIVAVKKQRGGYLLVDEAHSFGVTGPNGRGLAEEAGVEQDVDIILGTFSKSLAAIGGFATGSKEMEVLRYSSRPYIFTASPSPASIASVRASLRTIAGCPALRNKLWDNARRLYHGLSLAGYQSGPRISPVVPVMIASQEEGLRLWRDLIDHGVYVNLVLPPAAPAGMTLLRCSVNAAHSEQQIDKIIQVFTRLKQ